MFNRDIVRYLEEWKEKSGRKPLVLRGARQVGKTSAVKLFAERRFDDFAYVNLDRSEDFERFKNVRSLEDFERIMDVVLKKKLEPGKTLLFVDEIQNCPDLIALLRFFYEERPGLHVIAAGSLLEVKLARKHIAMPVGRVEYAFMYPLTFFEFLEAMDEGRLLDFLIKVDLEKEVIPEPIHERALKLFFRYALVGGMPEAVALTLRKSPQQELDAFYASLLTAYAEDVSKYASSADSKYIRHALEQAPYFAGERITYEKFGGSLYRSREMSEAFDILEKTMLVRQVRATESKALPIVKKEKRAKKLLYLDVGLVNFKNDIRSEYLRVQDLNDVYRGKIAEQIVGQNILAGGTHGEQPLYYWAKERPFGSAEVDFCLMHQGRMVGVEVKSGHAGKLRSLASFGASVEKSVLLRMYGGSFKKESITGRDRKHTVISLPFYLVNRMLDFC